MEHISTYLEQIRRRLRENSGEPTPNAREEPQRPDPDKQTTTGRKHRNIYVYV
jgi:hypothetical protein